MKTYLNFHKIYRFLQYFNFLYSKLSSVYRSSAIFVTKIITLFIYLICVFFWYTETSIWNRYLKKHLIKLEAQLSQRKRFPNSSHRCQMKALDVFLYDHEISRVFWIMGRKEINISFDFMVAFSNDSAQVTQIFCWSKKNENF